MREQLAARVGQRRTYCGRVARIGGHAHPIRGWERTALLVEVRDVADGELVASHVWLRDRAVDAAMGRPHVGDVLQFTAIARSYDNTTGLDVKLVHPRDVHCVTWARMA